MTVIRFPYVTVTIDHNAQRVLTRFADGKLLEAIPVVDAVNVAHARELGYTGSDAVWQMTAHHDCLHTVLAVMDGRPWSPTLRAGLTRARVGQIALTCKEAADV